MTDTAPGNLKDTAALLRRFFAVREARIIQRAEAMLDDANGKQREPAREHNTR